MPSIFKDIKKGFKDLSLRHKLQDDNPKCAQCEPFIYNLNENIWQEWHRGIRKEITFSKNSNCTICSSIRREFQTAYDSSAGDFSESQSFLLNAISGTEIYCLYPSTPTIESERRGIYLLPLETPDEKPKGRRTDSIIDFDLVKEWIKCCENWHGKSCDLGDHISFNESGEFLVVDAVEGCLVNIPCSARYVALSYVWGGAKTLATCKDNVDKLMRPGALFSRLDEISRTRRDAINLIPLIGERYVWIDVLCMVQDDPDMNKILVNQMDKIYQNAVCTVVVAVGNDANVALPAISTDSPRQYQQQILAYGEERRLAFSQRPIQNSLGQNENSAEAACAWTTRAWTHQERLLPGRKLVFLEDGAHFNCQKMTWTEDTDAEKYESFHHHFQMYDFHGVTDSDRFFSGIFPPSGWPKKKDEFTLDVSAFPNWLQYVDLVGSHMRRDLTFEEDVLDSFMGILNKLSASFGRFTWGMSDYFLSLALLWQPKDFCRRRQLTKGHDNPPDLDMPSWSWPAWVCDIDLRYWKAACDFMLHDDIHNTYRTTPTVQYKDSPTILEDDSVIVPIRDTWAQYQNESRDAFDWEESLPTPWEVMSTNPHYDRGRQETCQFICKNEPTRYFKYPIPLPSEMSTETRLTPSEHAKILLFTTGVATFVVSTDDFPYADRKNAASVLDADGQWCGVVILQYPLSSSISKEEFVEISNGEVFIGGLDGDIFPEAAHVKGLVKREEFYKYANVLMTKTRDDGTRVRIGIGRIIVQAWEGADREVKNVLLG